MNILTDILSLIKRGKFTDVASNDDVIVLGMWNEKPEMTGVASPIPYKSVKLIKVRDLAKSENCDYTNVPAIPAGGTVGIYKGNVIDPTTKKCTVSFRSLKSLSSNLTLAVSANDNYIEITTEGEPNLAANVGTGAGIWKNKIGETLNFKSLKAGNNISFAETADEITISSSQSLPYTSFVQLLSQDGSVPPTGPILENSAGITINWVYNQAGQYVATYSTPLADINKTAITCSQTTKTSSGGVIVSVTSSFATGFNITTINTSNQGVDSQLLGAVLEIRIYP
ncbi:hypothetical protein N9176_00090 [bacterium]|nr:hypothetical protein [bacterium]